MTTPLLKRLVTKEDLSAVETEQLVHDISQGKLDASQIAAVLVALKMKGETREEIISLARGFIQEAVSIPGNFSGTMDNCGTGGDQAGTFNISTTAAFVLAAGGVLMAKHGNRSISSKSGSADVLEALGINVDLTADRLAQVLEKTGMAFIFARNMHPAMKMIQPVRMSLGIPTIMNVLGPFIHPLPLDYQLLGTSRVELVETTAEVLKELGRKRAVVISGEQGLDEASLYGENTVAILENNQITVKRFKATDYGFKAYGLSDILGDDAKHNADILVSVLENQASPYLEATVLNAGLGFYAAGLVDSFEAGFERAREVLADGLALEKLKALQEAQV